MPFHRDVKLLRIRRQCHRCGEVPMVRKKRGRANPSWGGFIIAIGVAATGCGPPPGDPNGNSWQRRGTSSDKPLGRQIAYLGDLHQPESVKYDSEQDVFFISNMVGFGTDRDGFGYIVQVSAPDLSKSRIFAQSGNSGVIMDAPKGMAIHGDTLWICDIDKMRALHRVTGLPLATVDLAPHGAVLLNDVTVGADGAIYITDTGILMTPKGVIHKGGDRVFMIRGGNVTVVAAGDILGRPNGITWDREGNRLVVVSFDPFHSEMYTVSSSGERRKLASGNGKFDGIEPLGGGRFLVACWNDSSVLLLGGGDKRRLASNVMQPADIGYDTRRRRIAIPVGPLNQMQLWQLPPNY